MYLRKAMMTVATGIRRTREALPAHRGEEVRDALWVTAGYLLPRRVVYYAAIRLGVEATTGRYGSTVVPELGLMDAIKRWER